MEVGIGFVLGIVSSLLTWWAVARYLGPRMVLSEKITVVPTTVHLLGRPQRFKVMNTGRWRGLAEVRAVARLRVRGLQRAKSIYPDSRLTFDIALSSIDSCVDYIAPRQGWIFTLDPREIVSPYVVFLPEGTRSAVEEGRCSLRDLLALGSTSELEVFVSATDAYSGVRRTTAKTYRASDVVDGYFALDSLTVVPTTSSSGSLGHRH